MNPRWTGEPMPRCPFSRLALIAIFPAALLAPACSAGGGGGSGGSGGSTSSSGEGGAGGSTSSAGGASGSTSSVGSASSAASGTGGSAVLSCANLPLCDDFEGAAEGGPPDAAKWMIASPNCSGTGKIAVDAGQAHSGAKSLKVTGGGGYCDHVFIANTAAVAAIGEPVYGRFFVRFNDPLGDGHTTFMTLKDAADNNKDLRMGGQSKILMWNRESDDATLPSLSPAGIAKSTAPAAQKWLCIEFMVDEANSLIQTWVDGAEIEGLHVDGAPTPDIDQQWLNKAGWKPSLTDFKLGWESYAGQPLTLWFDDVALAGQRLGCE
jgi:hypothetical protein